MTVLTKADALGGIRRSYGAAMAAALARLLPERIDLDDADDVRRLIRLGLAPERLRAALGREW